MSERPRTTRTVSASQAGAVRGTELARLLGRGHTLVNYGDTDGEVHRVMLRGALVVDLCRVGGSAVVVCELAEDEGEAHALATLHEGGYVERARTEHGRLCRALRPADVGDDEGEVASWAA